MRRSPVAIKFVPKSVIQALQTILDMHQNGIPPSLKLVKASHLKAVLEEHDRNVVLIDMLDGRINSLEAKNRRLEAALGRQQKDTTIIASHEIRGSINYEEKVNEKFKKRKSMGKRPLLKVKPIEGVKDE
jgi:hypothetical protein